MEAVLTAAGTLVMMLSPATTTARMLHIINPTMWQVIPYDVESYVGGLRLVQTAPALPLLHAALRRPKSITLADLRLLNLFFGIGNDASSRSELLKAVAARCGNDEFVDLTLQADKHTTSESSARTLMADPLVEAAFDEMPADDQGEFPELAKEKRISKYRRREAGRTGMAPLHPQRMRPQTKHCLGRETNPKFGQPALSTTIHFQLEPKRRQMLPCFKG